MALTNSQLLNWIRKNKLTDAQLADAVTVYSLTCGTTRDELKEGLVDHLEPIVDAHPSDAATYQPPAPPAPPAPVVADPAAVAQEVAVRKQLWDERITWVTHTGLRTLNYVSMFVLIVMMLLGVPFLGASLMLVGRVLVTIVEVLDFNVDAKYLVSVRKTNAPALKVLAAGLSSIINVLVVILVWILPGESLVIPLALKLFDTIVELYVEKL